MAKMSALATLALSGVVPRAIHAGENAVVSKYTFTTTLSISDTIDICKIPDGAIITSVSVTNNGDCVDAKINVGTVADHDKYIESQTFQARTVYAAKGLGDKLDVSDAASPQYTVLRATISDAGSASGSNVGTLTFVVKYIMGGI